MVEMNPIPARQVDDFVRNGRLRTLEPSNIDLELVRAEMREDCRRFGGDPEVIASVHEVSAGGVPALLYRPTGGEDSVLVWIHGGGWVIGDPHCYDTLARRLANRVGCAVLSVDYRLAPEHVYPTAVGDCWAATAWAAEHFGQVAVGGDSAGGNLAAVMALRCVDEGLDLSLQLLVYPVLDFRTESPAYQAFRDRYVGFAGDERFGDRCHDEIRLAWDYYVPDASQRAEPWASPMQAPNLGSVAPALVILAEHDILREEGEDYVRRLRDEGVSVQVQEYPGQIHGFFHMLAAMDDAEAASDLAADALGKAFRR